MNKEKLQGYLEKVKTAVGKVSKKIWIIAAVVLVLIAAVIVYVLNNQPYSVLVTGSTTDELSSIMSWLEDQGVQNYRLEGDKILVPEGQEMALKTRMIMEGYPKSGYLYETYFDNISAMSTSEERKVALLLGTQERLSAIVSTFEGVKSATVNLTESEDNRFILYDDNRIEATAAVTLTMQSGQMLSNEQADAIRNMIAHSVQGLSVTSVSIVDTTGNTYNNSSAQTNLGASELKIQLEEQWQNKIRTEVMQILAVAFGEDNVRTAVNVNVEVSTSSIEDRTVHIPEWAADGSTNGRGIIGSEVWNDEANRTGDNAAGGLVGTPSNSEIRTYPGEGIQVNGNEDYILDSGQIDYDNGETITHTDRSAAYITDCTIAVTLNSNVATGVNLADLRGHVAKAAGILAVDTEEMTAEEYLNSRISIWSTPFPGSGDLVQPGTPGIDEVLGIPMWAVYGLAGGLLLFIILLVIILILVNKRNKKRRQLAEEQAAAEAALLQSIMPAGEEGEEPTTGADVMSLKTEKSMELRQNIRQFAEENPEIAAQLVKSWLRGDDKDG